MGFSLEDLFIMNKLFQLTLYSLVYIINGTNRCLVKLLLHNEHLIIFKEAFCD